MTRKVHSHRIVNANCETVNNSVSGFRQCTYTTAELVLVIRNAIAISSSRIEFTFGFEAKYFTAENEFLFPQVERDKLNLFNCVRER